MLEFVWKEYIVPLWLDILVAGSAIALGSRLARAAPGLVQLWAAVMVINIALYFIPHKLMYDSTTLTVIFPAVLSYGAAAFTSIKAVSSRS
jgi:hypothetical protein